MADHAAVPTSSVHAVLPTSSVEWRLHIVEQDLAHLYSLNGLEPRPDQSCDDDSVSNKRFCASIPCIPPSSNNPSERDLNVQCRACVAVLNIKMDRLEVVFEEMLKTIYGQGGVDLVRAGSKTN